MQVEHFEKGVSYSDEDRLLLAKKLGKLVTYCRMLQNEGSKISVQSVRDDTKKDRDQVKVTVTVHLPKAVLRAESRKFTALDALDRCVEKLEEDLKLYKDMHTGKGRARIARRNKAA